MYKKLLVLFLLLVSLTACAENETTAPASMLPPEEGKYVLLLLFDENTPQQEVNEVSDAVIGPAQAAGVLHEAVISLRPDQYGIETEEYPAIVIVDSREVVLETMNVEEAVTFFKGTP